MAKHNLQIGLVIGALTIIIGVFAVFYPERAIVTLSFNTSIVLSYDISNSYTEIVVNNHGKSNSNLDLIVHAEHAQVSFDKKSWGQESTLNILATPNDVGSFKIYVIPEQNTETFSLYLSYSKKQTDINDITVVNTNPINYQNVNNRFQLIQ